MAKKLLVVEDELDMAEILADNLEDEGYDVEMAHDGREALNLWRSFTPDLVILDVMLPFFSGYDVCRTMREEGAQTPVLFLSAKGQPEARVQGLSSGGDDYLTKPFHLPELLLRIRNMLQRARWQAQSIGASSHEIETIGGMEVDLREWLVKAPQGQEIRLREEEVRLLRFLLAHPDQILDRDALLDGVWQDDIFPSSRELENLFQRFREVFEERAERPRYFHSRRGMRFCFSPRGKDTPLSS